MPPPVSGTWRVVWAGKICRNWRSTAKQHDTVLWRWVKDINVLNLTAVVKLSVVSIKMTLHVMPVQAGRPLYLRCIGFKLQRPKNRTLGHAAVDGETGRRSIGISERLSAVVEVELTPIKHSVSQREPLRQNWYKYLVVDGVKRCTEVQQH